MRKSIIVLLLPVSLFAQELVGSFTVDLQLYEDGNESVTISVRRGPFSGNMVSGGFDIYGYNSTKTELLFCWQKKYTDQYDIFSSKGKCGSLIIPTSAFPANVNIFLIFISQTILDTDTGFESLVCYSNPSPENDPSAYTGVTFFKALDETGNQILADSGTAGYGFDGQNTYVWSVVRYPANNYTFKTWRFRTNIASVQPSLSKTAATPGPMMVYMPSGNLRVNLQPVSGGTSIRIFDMLGRQLFKKTVHDIKEPMSFTIPSRDIPNSPFVTRVNNSNGSFVKKEIPVR